jgi:spastin
MLFRKLLQGQNSSMRENDVITLARQTDGYSCSDITALARDAAMGPLRDLTPAQVREMPADQIRKINRQDFMNSLKRIRPSVNKDNLKIFDTWNRDYGSSV